MIAENTIPMKIYVIKNNQYLGWNRTQQKKPYVSPSDLVPNLNTWCESEGQKIDRPEAKNMNENNAFDNI